MRRKNWELKGIFWIITLLFVGFLAAPILLLLGKSLLGDGGLTGEFYISVVTRDGSLSAHYENTILVTDGEPEILTL